VANTLNTINAITNAVARTRNPNLWMDGNVVFRMMPKPTEDAGLKIQVPVRHAQHPVEGYVGLQSHSPQREEWQKTAYFEWVQRRVGKTYARIDILKNSGNKQAVINYIKSLEMNADESFADDAATSFLGTANNSVTDPTVFNSFQHVANDAADTLVTGTDFGDLDKDVVVDANGVKVWAGKVIDLAGAGHGPTLTNLIRGMAQVKNGDRKPNIVCMHEEVLQDEEEHRPPDATDEDWQGHTDQTVAWPHARDEVAEEAAQSQASGRGGRQVRQELPADALGLIGVLFRTSSSGPRST
jgi:hypothetical protein